MKAETGAYLAKARHDLKDARVAREVGLTQVTARLAYYTMFHVAEAFVFERSGKNVKTHNGVRSEFARLSRDDAAVDPSFRRALAQSYVYKEIADYALEAPLEMTARELDDAIDTASRFLDAIENLFLPGR